MYPSLYYPPNYYPGLYYPGLGIPLSYNWIKNDRGAWTLTWQGMTAAFYRIVLWGEEIARVSAASYTWTGPSYTTFPPPLEVLPGNTRALSEVYWPYLVMQWYGESVGFYTVQEFAGAWTEIGHVQDSNLWVASFRTDRLHDNTSHAYRVLAVDAFGNSSLPRPYSYTVVCPPEPPDGTIRIGYTSPNITIESA